MLTWIDGRAFAPYTEWECFNAGFHDVPFDEQAAEKSRALYCDIPSLRLFTFRVINEWPITAAVHLSQPRNHRAWMGHAACFISHRAGMLSSIAAYWMLDDAGREAANNCVMEGAEAWKMRFASNLRRECCQTRSAQLGFPF